MKNYEMISSGGVVYKKDDFGIHILLLHRTKSELWPYDSWHLPKGVLLSNESIEQAAHREILGGTGYKVKIVNKIGELDSSAQVADKDIQKLTHYFLCTPVEMAGSQDSLCDKPLWIPLDKAIELVSEFPIWENEQEVLSRIEELVG